MVVERVGERRVALALKLHQGVEERDELLQGRDALVADGGAGGAPGHGASRSGTSVPGAGTPSARTAAWAERPGTVRRKTSEPPWAGTSRRRVGSVIRAASARGPPRPAARAPTRA